MVRNEGSQWVEETIAGGRLLLCETQYVDFTHAKWFSRFRGNHLEAIWGPHLEGLGLVAYSGEAPLYVAVLIGKSRFSGFQ